MRQLVHTALAFLILHVPQPAFSDSFSEGIQSGLLEFFDVSDPAGVTANMAGDPHLKGGASSGAAADGFAKLLYTKTPQKLTELRLQSNKQVRERELSEGQNAFTRHLGLAASEALKIIDGRRRPVDPRQNQDGDFLNDFADRYSNLVQPELETLRAARKEQLKEPIPDRVAQSQEKRDITDDSLGKPHLKKKRKRRVPAPEETAAAKHWAQYGNSSPRQIEDLLVDVNTPGADLQEVRNEAGRKLLAQFFDPSAGDGGILGRATSKNLSAASRWKDFGLKEIGYQTLRSLNEVRKQDNVRDLRRRAYGENSPTAKEELVRRVNQSAEADPLGNTIRSDFKNLRPELLLSEEKKLVGDENSSAQSFAHLLGASNSAVLQDLASRSASTGNTEKSLYEARLACAAALSLKSRDPKASNAADKNCEGQKSFTKAFESALKKDMDRYKTYQNWIEAAKDPSKLEAARAWMLDPQKSGYEQENLVDRLGERVQSALDSRLPQPERRAALDEAVTLAKILGHQDPTSGDWSLDLIARDAGMSAETPASQTLILGQGEEIFAALARYSRRDTDNHAPKTAVRFGTRSRFQSFSRDPRKHAEHLADKTTRVFYAPEGEDKKNSLGTGTVSYGRATHIGRRARLVPAGLETKPPRNPSSLLDLTAQVEALLRSSSCVECHAAPKSLATLKSFLTSAGLDGNMPGGPSLRDALAGNPSGQDILKRYLSSLNP